MVFQDRKYQSKKLVPFWRLSSLYVTHGRQTYPGKFYYAIIELETCLVILALLYIPMGKHVGGVAPRIWPNPVKTGFVFRFHFSSLCLF